MRPPPAVVRSTVPGVFCAGADLKERASMSQAEAATFVRQLREAFTRLGSLPMPTVACVDGWVAVALLRWGGGSELGHQAAGGQLLCCCT